MEIYLKFTNRLQVLLLFSQQFKYTPNQLNYPKPRANDDCTLDIIWTKDKIALDYTFTTNMLYFILLSLSMTNLYAIFLDIHKWCHLNKSFARAKECQRVMKYKNLSIATWIIRKFCFKVVKFSFKRWHEMLCRFFFRISSTSMVNLQDFTEWLTNFMIILRGRNTSAKINVSAVSI